jgi:hypothetical protein
VCLTIPLYDPVAKKLINDKKISSGIKVNKCCSLKLNPKLNLTKYVISKELSTKNISISNTNQRGDDFISISLKKSETKE